VPRELSEQGCRSFSSRLLDAYTARFVFSFKQIIHLEYEVAVLFGQVVSVIKKIVSGNKVNKLMCAIIAAGFDYFPTQILESVRRMPPTFITRKKKYGPGIESNTADLKIQQLS
jgi:hypothetical protein